MTTPFATFLRRARLDAKLSQAEVAAGFGKSKGTILAFEQGKVLPRSPREVCELSRIVEADDVKALTAYFKSLAEFEPQEESSSEGWDFMALFIQEMNRHEARLKSTGEGEIQSVSPLSNNGIRELVRKHVFRSGTTRPPIVTTEEFDEGGLPIVSIYRDRLDQLAASLELEAAIEFNLVDANDWWEAEIIAKSHERIVVNIRDDVWERATEGDGRARWTLAHELGHAILHHRELLNQPMAKMFRDSAQTPSVAARKAGVPPFRSPEHQAQIAASELLMPTDVFLKKGKELSESNPDKLTTEEFSKYFQVSRQAAEIRLSSLYDEIIK